MCKYKTEGSNEKYAKLNWELNKDLNPLKNYLSNKTKFSAAVISNFQPEIKRLELTLKKCKIMYK